MDKYKTEDNTHAFDEGLSHSRFIEFTIKIPFLLLIIHQSNMTIPLEIPWLSVLSIGSCYLDITLQLSPVIFNE